MNDIKNRQRQSANRHQNHWKDKRQDWKYEVPGILFRVVEKYCRTDVMKNLPNEYGNQQEWQECKNTQHYFLNAIQIHWKIVKSKNMNKKKLPLGRSSFRTISDGLIFVIASAVKTTAATTLVATTAAAGSISSWSCFVNHQGLTQEVETV